MPHVTKITPQKRSGFYNIFVDGSFSFSLDEAQLVEQKLRSGDELTGQRLKKLKKASHDRKLYHAVLRLLGSRPRSVQEVRAYLKYTRKAESDVIEALIGKLLEGDYLDDTEFARWWVEQRRAQKKGPYLIKRELMQKGVSRSILRNALDLYPRSEQEVDVRVLAQQRVRRLEELPSAKKIKKLSSFLLRRGYPWEVVRKIVHDVLK